MIDIFTKNMLEL